MEIPEWIAVISVVVALVSLAVQQHLTRQQLKAEARTKQHDRTQVLIFKALENDDLLKAISGDIPEDQKAVLFRQLWFNHVEMFFRQRKLFDRHHWEGSMGDIGEFMNMPDMRKHWSLHKQYYASDFREFMDREIYSQWAEPQ